MTEPCYRWRNIYTMKDGAKVVPIGALRDYLYTMDQNWKAIEKALKQFNENIPNLGIQMVSLMKMH